MGNSIKNWELARRYKEKCKLLGIENIFEYRLIKGDRVRLDRVKDTEDTGRLVIPSFITDIKSVAGIDGRVRRGVLEDCKYSEVYIENRGDLEIDVGGLCRGMLSSKLKVRFKHPECVVGMQDMFKEDIYLVEIDISSFDTRKVTDMNSMFNWCKGLEEIDISNLDMSGVESIYSMFNCCKLLRRVDMSKIKTNTNKVTDMSYLFNMCYNLEEIDISCLDTSKVEDMSYIFNDCKLLKKVDLSGLDTSKVEDMRGMFKGCESLKDVRGRLVINDKCKMFDIFNGCKYKYSDKLVVSI